MKFEFATAARVVFGPGRRAEVFAAAARFGSRALLVTGADSSRAEWLRSGLREQGIDVEPFSFPAEPSLDRVEEGRRAARAAGCQLVIALGGGSAIDGGKALAALAPSRGEIAYYLEIIGGAKPLEAPPLPFIAIPTTAGTGAEVTRNAVLLSPEHELKVSLRSPKMLPALAIVDSELTLGLPPSITANTGMDALTQLIEPFLSARANPLTDGLCREGIPRAARALPVAFRDPAHSGAREEMALASLFGGLALANAGLGAVHGFAAAIGGKFAAPHGAVCAALLPAVLEVNCRALRERDSQAAVLGRFDELGKLLTGHAHAGARQAIHAVRSLVTELGIARLGHFGVEREHIPLLCSRAAQASSMKANPIALTAGELAKILECSI